MFEFLALLAFGLFAIRSAGAKRVIATVLIALLFIMDSGAHTAVIA